MILIVDFGSTKVPNIKQCLVDLGYKVSVLKYNSLEKNIQANTVILSGSPTLLTKVDFKNFSEKLSFIKHQNIPVLGICFGHQLLGLMHGSQVYLGEPVRDETLIRIEQNDPLLDGLTNEFVMAEDHTEGITLPNDFIHLASSDKYPIEAMKHRSKPFYGVQFHPEVSGSNGLLLLKNFCKLAVA